MRLPAGEQISRAGSVVMLPLARDVAAVSGCDGACGHRGAEYWRREAIEARSRAGSLAGIHRRNKEQLEAVRAELRSLRREAKASLAAVAEASRPRRLLEQMSVDPQRRSTSASLRQENGELRHEVAALRAANAVLREALAGPAESGRLASRIAALEQQLCALKAMRSNDTRHRFGDRSERQARAASPRRRGQQPGRPGPGRTPRPALWAAVCRARICRVRSGRDHRGGAYAAHPPSALSQRLRLRRPGHRGRAPGAAPVPAHGLWDFGVGQALSDKPA